jgi:lantibiotic modifying enzyme
VATLTGADTQRLRAAAERAADLLVANAIVSGGRATWLGATMEWTGAGVETVNRTGDPALYDGSAGIAMAAWSVAAPLRRDDLADIAVAAARHAVSAGDHAGGVGLFDGLAGIGLAALEIGDGAGDRRLRADGVALLGRVAKATPSHADIISGSAGIVVALLAAARRAAPEQHVGAATRWGHDLLASALRRGWGWSWPSPDPGGPDLCGLAHGAAGVAWALGLLADATGDDRFLDAVAGVRRYERSWFQPAENSWPDLRPETCAGGSPLVCPALWCHGATGIGLTRLALWRLAEHPALEAEAASALQAATAAASHALAGHPGAGLTLCHGLGGTVLLLLAAHDVLGAPEHLAAARWVAAQALDQLGEDPTHWPSGLPDGSFSPGLMTGIAGTMYALARAADPAATDALSVLAEPWTEASPIRKRDQPIAGAP